MKRKLIVQAKIGDVWFNVYTDPNLDAANYKIDWHPTGNNTINLGLGKIVDYSEAFERLMHETVEVALTLRNGATYLTSAPRDYPAYKRFAFTHEDFQHAMTDAAHFMTVVAPLYYKEVHKKYPLLPRLHGEKPYIGKAK